MDFAGQTTTPLHIHNWTRFGVMPEIRAMGGGVIGGSTAWGTANLAVYLPLWLPFNYTVQRMFWGNGTAAGGNTSVGLYSAAGTLIYGSAATAESGNSALQYVTPTSPILLPPGNYYMAYTHSATTANHIHAANNFNTPRARMAGILQQSSVTAFSAVTTWTPAAYTTSLIPMVGITRTASGF